MPHWYQGNFLSQATFFTQSKLVKINIPITERTCCWIQMPIWWNCNMKKKLRVNGHFLIYNCNTEIGCRRRQMSPWFSGKFIVENSYYKNLIIFHTYLGYRIWKKMSFWTQSQ